MVNFADRLNKALEDLEVDKNAPAKEKNILQPDEIKKLFSIDYIDRYGKHRPCFFIYAWRFLLLTGMRRGELCGLKNEDIQNGIIHIKRSINEFNEVTSGKNENARRYLALSPQAVRVLEAQKEMLKEKCIISPWVFPDEKGYCLEPKHLYKTWRTYRKQHEIDCSLHGFRHTMISVSKADVPEQLLKDYVGHAEKMDIFGTYGHDVEGEMKRVANILGEVFNRILK